MSCEKHFVKLVVANAGSGRDTHRRGSFDVAIGDLAQGVNDMDAAREKLLG
jgi:hypothetical protein